MLLKRLLLALFLLVPSSAFATLAGTVNWNVLTTGNNANGGCFDPGVSSPGTDYSQQTSAQIAYTDLVIGSTNTQLTSAGNPFGAADVGNCINITGGTGFTTGWYEVLSVSGTTATMDRAVGTASSTGGTGNLGGSLLTLAQANTNVVAGNTVWLSGTYTLTATITMTACTINWEGYTSVHGDLGKATITTATSSIALFNSGSCNGGTHSWLNITFSTTASTKTSAIWEFSAHGSSQAWSVINCKFSAFPIDLDSSDVTPDDVGVIYTAGTEFTGATTAAIYADNTTAMVTINGGYFHGNALDLIQTNAHTVNISFSIFSGASGSESLDLGAGLTNIVNSVFYNATGTAVAAGAGGFTINNTIFYGNNKAISTGSTVAGLTSSSNAFGNNTNANTDWISGPTDITLTANPFVSSSTGNFALNMTAGGGALLSSKGIPITFPGGTTTTVLSVGVAQPTSSGSSAKNSSYAK
jgi:hypothetical protein